MAKIQKISSEKKNEKAYVKSLSKYQNHVMININGNFIKGGFQISKNKAKAILDNEHLIRRIVNGEFDEQVQKLNSDEILDMSDEQ